MTWALLVPPMLPMLVKPPPFLSSLPSCLLAQRAGEQHPFKPSGCVLSYIRVTQAYRCTEEQNNSSFFSWFPAMALCSTSATGRAGPGVGVQDTTNNRAAGGGPAARRALPGAPAGLKAVAACC